MSLVAVGTAVERPTSRAVALVTQDPFVRVDLDPRFDLPGVPVFLGGWTRHAEWRDGTTARHGVAGPIAFVAQDLAFG